MKPATQADQQLVKENIEVLKVRGAQRYHSIAANNFVDTLTAAEFMNLTKVVYDLCSTYQKSPEVYQLYSDAVRNYIQEVVLDRLAKKQDEIMLETLVQEFSNFRVFLTVMSHLFMRLNRFYVEEKKIANLLDLGYISFDELIISQPIGAKLIQASLDLICRHREGEIVQKNAIKETAGMLYEIGQGKSKKRDVYSSTFEKQFLESSKAYFKARGEVWINESLPDFFIKVDQLLVKEMQFSGDHLPAVTLPKLEQCLLSEILEAHMQSIFERQTGGLQSLLTDRRVEDISRAYRLFGRMRDGLKPLSEQFHIFVKTKGFEITRSFDPALSHKEESVVDFINKVMKLYSICNGLLTDCFEKSKQFETVMHTAFELVLNAGMGPEGSTLTCAELLSSYCDSLLKSGKMTDEMLEEKLEHVTHLFSYIIDKDLFVEFYRKQLAKRLLQKQSDSDDAEKRLLELLKVQCGAHFTSKLEGMIKDSALSSEHLERFRTFLESRPQTNLGGVDFSVQVLTAGYWPTYPATDYLLGPELSVCIDAFKDFYSSTTRHRTLKWVHNMGQLSLTTPYNLPSEIGVSTPQALIILLFNRHEKLSFDEVRSHTNLSQKEAERQLLTLACGKFKVLKKEPQSKEISSTDVFSLNPKFTADKKKVKIPTISSKEMNQEEVAVTQNTVQEDRKHAIEAAIVRIMKARKRLEFQKLVLETSQQLMRYFKPDVKMIKSRMEDLITREYLERDEENAHVLKYLA
eukprot:c20204_g1_i1.p1 GENE.c20204_g1_i1~~c20204_g1_i1.p1  ORF type:complete len:745 (+),score=218.02 c20204_g1_i1:55-2289(+)